MNIRLWKGYHSEELRKAISDSLNRTPGTELLIVCPPLIAGLSFVNRLPPFESISLVGSWTPESATELESCLRAVPADSDSRTRYPDSPLLGVFTSGTVSGAARLVFYSKQNIETSLTAILGQFERNRITSIYCYPQPFHTFGLLLGYALASKLEVPLVSSPEKYGRSAHALRCSLTDPGLLTLGAPIHFMDLLEFVRTSEVPIHPSYSCIVGGASASKELWRSIRDELLVEAPSIGYGCTEASPGITHLRAGKEPSEYGEIGFPLGSITSTIVPQMGVKISGDSLCLAIIENNEVYFPQELFIRDDIRVRDDGTWIYNNRLDLVINRGGVKYSLETIETAINTETGVSAIALGIPDRRLGQELVVAIQRDDLNANHELKIKIAAIVGAKFGLRLSNSHISVVSKFPLNESAKIDRLKITNDMKPVPARDLFEALPHRPPMVWVDEVIVADETGGTCRVDLKHDGLYLTDGSLRPSSLIELMAQSFGYIIAANQRRSPSDGPKISKAFLISISNSKLEYRPDIGAGRSVNVHISNVRTIGSVTLFNGSVLLSDGTPLGTADLKVYSEYA